MATVTIYFDEDGSEISYFDVPPQVADNIAMDYLMDYKFSHKV